MRRASFRQNGKYHRQWIASNLGFTKAYAQNAANTRSPGLQDILCPPIEDPALLPFSATPFRTSFSPYFYPDQHSADLVHDKNLNLFAGNGSSYMTLFEDRERAFEQMFVHDEEARFRALARRNKLLGQWAATQLGLTGEKADAYVKDVSGSLVAKIVDESLVEKLRADFDAHGVGQSDEQIREKMAELMSAALNQVRSSAW